MDVYMKQKIKRSMIYWGKLSQSYSLIFIAIAFVYSFLEIAGDTMNMFLMMAVMGSLIIPITYIQAFFPTVISFGSGRKEAVLGIQWMAFLYIAEYAIATWIARFFFPTQFMKGSVYEQFWLMLGMTGIGQIISAICLLKKSKSRTVWLIVFGCIAFLSAVCGIVVSTKDFIDTVMDRSVFQIGLTIGSLVVYLISVFVFIKCTKKYAAFSAQ